MTGPNLHSAEAAQPSARKGKRKPAPRRVSQLAFEIAGCDPTTSKFVDGRRSSTSVYAEEALQREEAAQAVLSTRAPFPRTRCLSGMNLSSLEKRVGQFLFYKGRRAVLRSVKPHAPKQGGRKKSGTDADDTDFDITVEFGVASSAISESNPSRMQLCDDLSELYEYDEADWAGDMMRRAIEGRVEQKKLMTLLLHVVWNKLDSFSEALVLQNRKKIGIPLEKAFGSVDQTAPEEQSRRRASILLFKQEEVNISERGVPDDYTGPRLELPVSRKFALSLLETYIHDPDFMLPPQYAYQLLSAAEEFLDKTFTKPIMEISIPPTDDARLVMLGDVHGQLNDVLWAFFRCGPPSSSNFYLFNGDIADRGAHSVEIFFLAFAFMLSTPGSVWINRGNHESEDLNAVYGFSKEVATKYGGVFFEKFKSIFYLIPLASVVQQRVFVVHGGLPRLDGVTLADINKINYRRKCPTTTKTVEDTLFFDLLWNDPRPQEGRGPSTRGKECVTFGPDVTWNFLSINNLEVCIRSHQVPSNMHGFHPQHGGNCVTLFSASNYCGVTDNFGAAVVFNHQMNFDIQEYMAPKLATIARVQLETRSVTAKVVSKSRFAGAPPLLSEKPASTLDNRGISQSAILLLGRVVCLVKPKLIQAFQKGDPSGSGVLTLEALIDALTDVITDLPWTAVLRAMNMIETANNQAVVSYTRLLSRFRVEFRPAGAINSDWRREAIHTIFESVLFADLSIEEVLMVFDCNLDGKISSWEFREFLKEVNLGLSDGQIEVLNRLLTQERAKATKKTLTNTGASQLAVGEFFGRFKVAFGKHYKLKPGQQWIPAAIIGLGKLILADRNTAAAALYSSLINMAVLTNHAQSSDTSNSGGENAEGDQMGEEDVSAEESESEVSAEHVSRKASHEGEDEPEGTMADDAQIDDDIEEDREAKLKEAGKKMALRRRPSAVYSMALMRKFMDYHDIMSPVVDRVGDEAEGGAGGPKMTDASGQMDTCPGYLSFSQLVEALGKLPLEEIECSTSLPPLTTERLYEVARAIDVGGSGRINYLEFLSAFYVADGPDAVDVAEEVWCETCSIIFRNSAALYSAFIKYDPSQTGQIHKKEFKAALSFLNHSLSREQEQSKKGAGGAKPRKRSGPKKLPLSSEQLELLVACVTVDESSQMVNYGTFLSSFHIIDSEMPPHSLDDYFANPHLAPDFRDVFVRVHGHVSGKDMVDDESRGLVNQSPPLAQENAEK